MKKKIGDFTQRCDDLMKKKKNCEKMIVNGMNF